MSGVSAMKTKTTRTLALIGMFQLSTTAAQTIAVCLYRLIFQYYIPISPDINSLADYSKPPTTTTMSTTTMSTSASTASSTATTMAPAKTTVGNDQSSSNVVLYIGIAEGVVGLVGALFIIAASIVLYVTLKKVRGEESS